MISLSLGKRYERLLFFTAPITLAAMILCIASVGSATQKERQVSVCYGAAAKVFVEQEAVLKKVWEEAVAAEKLERRARGWSDARYKAIVTYKAELRERATRDAGGYDCFFTMFEVFDDLDKHENIPRMPPRHFIDSLNKTAEDLGRKPLVMYGVQLESSTTYDLVGTKIKVDLATLVLVLQVALLPVLLTWLGSLYATRYRETLLILHATSHVELYPHILNLYVTRPADSRIRQKRTTPAQLRAFCVLYALLRVGLLSLFLVPAAAAYVVSIGVGVLAYEPSLLRFLAAYFAMCAVGVFTFSVFLVEFFPSHAYKTFPFPLTDLDKD